MALMLTGCGGATTVEEVQGDTPAEEAANPEPTLTVTDNDRGVGSDEVIVDVRTPAVFAAISDPLVGAGILVEATGADITMRNEYLALTISKFTQDPQLTPETFGHVLDAAAVGHQDGLDWVKVGYIEESRTDGSDDWDIRTVSYDPVEVTESGPDHAAVSAAGTWTFDPGLEVFTNYDLDPLDRFVKLTSVLTNQTSSKLSFYFGDVLDFDGDGQQTYIPGIGIVSGSTGSTAQSLERWMGMWGTGPESYAILYEDPVIIHGKKQVKSSYNFDLEVGESTTFIRYLIITESTNYASQLDAVQDVIDDFPPPVAANVTVAVVDNATSYPLEGAYVSLVSELGWMTSGVTGPGGEVNLDVNPGNYTLRVRRSGYFAADPQILDLPEGPSDFTVRLEPRPFAGIEHVILVISDGMSWEKVTELGPPNISNMVASGAAATHGISEVPSVTRTNRRTISSGTHLSTHGVVGNAYLHRQSESVDTIEKAVARAGLTSETFTSASEIVSRINAGTLPNYSLWWWYKTDNKGHRFGPGSTNYSNAINSMDKNLGQIMDALGATGMDEITVLGLGADHGMQALLPDGVPAPNTSHIIDLRYILQEAGFSVASWRASGPRMGNVYLTDPSQAAAAKAVLAAMPGIDRVYTKSELDGTDLGGDIFAYLNHPNSGDVIAFAAGEYSFGRSVIQSAADGLEENDGRYYWDCSNDCRGGHGGLTPEDEYTPFVLWGDALEAGCSLGPRYNADWAPTIAAFLEIDPPYDSEGTAATDCLRNVVNHPPVANDDPASTAEDQPVTVYVLENDSDVDGDTLTVDSVTQGANGAVTNNGSNVTYTPDADYCGIDSFAYTVSDGKDGSDTATVTIDVTCVNDAPSVIANNTTVIIDESQTATNNGSFSAGWQFRGIGRGDRCRSWLWSRYLW